MTTPPTRTLVLEKEMPHPPEKIWRALTEGALLKEWLMDNDFRPIVGHRFTFRAPPMPHWDGIIESEVLMVEPSARLSYRWNALGLTSVVIWTLTATAGGTLVRMQQSGFRPDQDQAYKGAHFGWQKFLAGLEQVSAHLP